MVLLPSLIGNRLSCWMSGPSDDDDQPHRSARRSDEREDPLILWAVELADGRKTVLVEGARLFVGRSVMDIQTFDGLNDIAKALLNLGINNFAEAKGGLPLKVVSAIVAIEEAEEALRHPPQQIPLPSSRARQIPLPFPARIAS